MSLTYKEISTWLDQKLRGISGSSEQQQTEKRCFMQAVLGLSIEAVLSYPDKLFDDEAKLEELKRLLAQRITQRQPIQHLLGHTYFYGLQFQVTPDVLIPRPETEHLIEHAEKLIAGHHYQSVLDLGTGSGCIPITLKKRLPPLNITSIDVSKAALAVAEENAISHDVKINFLCGSWYQPLSEDKRFDLIISNPPYITRDAQNTLLPEVLKEPELALFSPDAPEQLYMQLIQEGLSFLNPNGYFLFELGLGVFETLAPLLEKSPTPLEWTIFQDYAGIDRVLQIKPRA